MVEVCHFSKGIIIIYLSIEKMSTNTLFSHMAELTSLTVEDTCTHMTIFGQRNENECNIHHFWVEAVKIYALVAISPSLVSIIEKIYTN